MKPVFDFIDAAGAKPYLLWYAPMMPHTPHNPPDRLLAKYASLPTAQAKYMAMIEWFDETVGELVAYIDKKGQTNNTLFVFLADNGWVQLEGQRALYETRAKLSPYDAGLRTPIFFRWKGKITPKRDDKTLATSLDIAPTILAAAGGKIPSEWRGRDARILGGRNQIYGAMFAHTSVDIAKPAANVKYRWMIKDNWKLIVPQIANLAVPIWEGRPETAWAEAPELYDLSKDPQETKNLAAEQTNTVKGLLKDLDAWWRP
jgi:uncharacterized sulfatase